MKIDLISFKLPDACSTLYIPAINEQVSSTEFWTSARSRFIKSPAFEESNPENRYDQRLIKVNVPYDSWTRISDIQQANLIAIKYYAGHGYYEIISAVNDNTIIVREKIPLVFGKKLPEDLFPFVNNTMKYTALNWVDTPEELMTYTAEKYTTLKLHDDCKFNLYKKIVNEQD